MNEQQKGDGEAVLTIPTAFLSGCLGFTPMEIRLVLYMLVHGYFALSGMPASEQHEIARRFRASLDTIWRARLRLMRLGAIRAVPAKGKRPAYALDLEWR